ncbi:MAG: response regulator [Bdellovibrionales bacterium]|nr:response regulator [Bdellovibrionales bacterium]
MDFSAAVKPKSFWRNLSVSKKLYVVVGVMAFLIAIELFTLLFAMRTLSSLRAFVGGEGSWSKAQKAAVLELQNYAWTKEKKHYDAFHEHLSVPLGDHKARLEMKKDAMDMRVVTNGFLEGGVHPHDIQPMVDLMRRFHEVDYIKRAIEAWEAADNLMLQLVQVSQELKRLIEGTEGRKQTIEIVKILERIYLIDRELTIQENKFSSTLGEGSRWLEQTLMILLVIAVATVESTGLLLTIAFSRGLKNSLNELHAFAAGVGAGDFSKTVPVRSDDELGQLARTLNRMAADLKDLSSEKKEAEGANRIKSLFLANMSHEIRTPLNAILGFVDLLKDESLSRRDRQRFVGIIERTGTGLATIINDILDISKVEAGKLEIEKAYCSIQQILKDVEAVMSLRSSEKGIELHIESPPIPDLIVTDPTRYKQILLNLIGNAVKFTNQGEVHVSFTTDDGRLHCRIRDTGVGVAAENRDKLFQPFSQVDLSIRKQFGGTGLGLILSRRLARLLGGDVVLEESQPGRGSTFVVSIRIADAALEQRRVVTKRSSLTVVADRSVQSLQGKRILLVEDSLDNQLLAEQYLTKEGAKVEMVGHGLAAIHELKHKVYDLVLMDMQMPVMDGYTATAQLREEGFKVPIIGITAHAMKEDLEKCLLVGCDDFLCKPYRRSDLIAMIQQHCAA